MKITVKSTGEVVTMDGVRARVWRGATESGAEIIVFITRIGVAESAKPEECAAFERELERAQARRSSGASALSQAHPMRLSADEVTVPIDWGNFKSDRGRCFGCGEQLNPPSHEFPNDTKPHTVLDCLRTLMRRAEVVEARRDG